MSSPSARSRWLAQIFFDYKRYVAVLKWLTLCLFAYVGALAVAKVVGRGGCRRADPAPDLERGYLTTIVAILGTTISPYLFFWQASQEAEDERIDPHKQPLTRSPLRTRRRNSSGSAPTPSSAWRSPT